MTDGDVSGFPTAPAVVWNIGRFHNPGDGQMFVLVQVQAGSILTISALMPANAAEKLAAQILTEAAICAGKLVVPGVITPHTAT